MSQLVQYIGAGTPGVILTLTGNSGGAVGPSGNNINVVGSGAITVTGNPGTSTLTITESGLVDTFATDSGNAVPAAGVITIHGGDNLNTSGAGSTVTINLDPLTNGQLFIGNTGNPATASTLTAGAGISITNGAGAITIATTAGGFTWTEVVGTSQAMAVENGYIANNAGLVTLTLPATAVIGDTMIVTGKGTGLFRIAQNAGQSINFVSSTTTVGVTGSLTAIERFDSIEIVCITANTTFNVVSSTGNFTVA